MNRPNNNYYVSRKSRMLKEFNGVFKSTRKVLPQFFNENKVNKLQDECRQEYLGFFPYLPFIGGKENMETINIIYGAILLSIIRTMEKEGLIKEQIGKLLFDTVYHYLYSKPSFLRKISGKIISSGFYINKIKENIKQSQLKKYNGNFVKELVESDEENFQFGYNYTECALHTMYKKYNAEEYLQYVCLADYIVYRSLGLGFFRTQTIANGAPHCDFRFHKNCETRVPWPPESLEEWNEFKGIKKKVV